MIYVVGSQGRLGAALSAQLEPEAVCTPHRSVYESWWEDSAASRIAKWFESSPAGSTVIVASGILDPRAPAEQIKKVNVALPTRIAEGASMAGLRVLTLGTIMEHLEDSSNAYIQSKIALGRTVTEMAASGDNTVHAQLHTLYGGGPPAPHMFLGQMLSALRKRTTFNMSPGHQLREYHHVEDLAAALIRLIDQPVTGITTISHGSPTSLRDLALYIYEQLDQPGNLVLSALPEPANDNFNRAFPRPDWLSGVRFRPQASGVSDYLKEMLALPPLNS
ncbi:NAD-dependent epimerase/dehydratase family protein [Hydrogenophaga sp. 5NK40-0174]|uniref:NAD-dependent epimerase/dehydratase family protein n=1 Tax=Hydrogenophaga sp. 5NK40-0174 TaxID=3127649 RepID=UPI0031091ED7